MATQRTRGDSESCFKSEGIVLLAQWCSQQKEHTAINYIKTWWIGLARLRLLWLSTWAAVFLAKITILETKIERLNWLNDA